jgi:hypothetical protein
MMTLFATPNFGAGGAVMLAVIIAWMIVIGLVIIGCILGAKLVRNTSAKLKLCGIFVLLASGIVLLSCWLGPSVYVRLAYGSYPLGNYADGTIKECMSKQEVEKLIGPPHVRHSSPETWTHWLNGIDGYVRLYFDPDGRVNHITVD